MYKSQHLFSALAVSVLSFWSACVHTQFDIEKVKGIEKRVALKLIQDLARTSCNDYKNEKYPHSVAADLVRYSIASLYKGSVKDCSAEIPDDVREATKMILQSRDNSFKKSSEEQFSNEQLDGFAQLEVAMAYASWYTRIEEIKLIQHSPGKYQNPVERIAALLLVSTKVKARYIDRVIGNKYFSDIAQYEKDFFNDIVATGHEIACTVIDQEMSEK